MIKRYFITGTDTDVGKTIVSIAILQAAQHRGYITAGYKPVASGSDLLPEGPRNKDALALQNNSSLQLSYQEVNPYTFTEATSPHIISTYEHRPINFLVLSAGLHALERKANWILIEGAGGWFTPLSKQHTFADWVTLEHLPVILVVGIKLGCINHAILTSKAIEHAGLLLAGWVANSITPKGNRYTEYLTILKHLIPAPLLGEVPWFIENNNNNNTIKKYIDLSMLANIHA